MFPDYRGNLIGSISESGAINMYGRTYAGIHKR